MAIDKSWKASLENFDGNFLERCERMWSDPAVAGRYYVLSGSRSRAHQALLYAASKVGGNPANKPGTSDHEYWEGRGARAMDVHPSSGKGGTFAELHVLARRYGFAFPYAGRGNKPEPWHMGFDPGRVALSKTPEQSTEDEESMSALIIEYPSGHKTIVTPDGAVFTAGTPYFGSMYSLEPGEKQGVANIRAATAVDTRDEAAGYILWAQNANQYKFTPQQWEQLKAKGRR